MFSVTGMAVPLAAAGVTPGEQEYCRGDIRALQPHDWEWTSAGPAAPSEYVAMPSPLGKLKQEPRNRVKEEGLQE